MIKRQRICLGDYRDRDNPVVQREKSLPVSREELLQRVWCYASHDLQYTPKNMKGTMSGVKYLVDHYGVTGKTMSLGEGEWIRDDLLGKGLRPRTVILRLFYYELIAEALGVTDDRGEALVIRKPKRCKPVNDYFTLEERDKMLGKAENVHALAVLWTGFCCGPRPDELCHIWTSDVEFSKREIVIRDHGQGVKTFKERRSRLNDSCMKAIKDWLEIRPLADHKCLFMNKFGGPLSPARLREIVKGTAVSAGIDRRTYPYMMRHSCATHILQNGGSVADAALQIGDTIETVVRHYLHQDYGSLDKVIRRL